MNKKTTMPVITTACSQIRIEKISNNNNKKTCLDVYFYKVQQNLQLGIPETFRFTYINTNIHTYFCSNQPEAKLHCNSPLYETFYIPITTYNAFCI